MEIGQPISREQMASIEKSLEESRVFHSVEAVVAKVIEELSTHALPMAIMIERDIWLPTNKWVLRRAEITSKNSVEFEFVLIWMGPNRHTSQIPSQDEVNQLTGFGPGSNLPHELKFTAQLTKIPTNDSCWATGVAPGIPKEYWERLEERIINQVQMLPWFADN
jgi:hypothetical protein